MAVRPYITLSIEALEHLATSSANDATVLEDLIDELHHRKNPRAQRLRTKLEGKEPLGASRRGLLSSVRGSQPAEAVSMQGGSGEGMVSTVNVSVEEYSVLLRNYESLRTTFTAEAELLARWGMTPTLPHEMQDFIFSQWTKRLLGERKPDSLSIHDLANDRERLAQERAHIQGSLEAHGLRRVGGIAATPSRGEGQ